MKKFLIIVLALLTHLTSFGWGQKGHDVVAYIAECNLSPEVYQKVVKKLDNHSLVYYANWLDNASYTDQYRYTKTWHYANVDEGYTYDTMPKNEKGDVVTAINNIELARNQYRNAVADFFPTVDMQASYSPTRQSMAVYGNNDISRYGNASINASWEIDICGTIRKEAEYYKKNYLATREQYHAVMVSLCSQVGIAYINLRV